ncbi:MAG: transposase, partial [bacterium]|nr:transposase [bacterium]
VVYEISAGCKRLLWVGKDRKESTINAFFDFFGDHAKNLEFICSDMWKPYLKVIALRASSAIHVLDRFHIMSMLSKAIEKVRAEEVKKLEADSFDLDREFLPWAFAIGRRRKRNNTGPS